MISQWKSTAPPCTGNKGGGSGLCLLFAARTSCSIVSFPSVSERYGSPSAQIVDVLLVNVTSFPSASTVFFVTRMELSVYATGSVSLFSILRILEIGRAHV